MEQWTRVSAEAAAAAVVGGGGGGGEGGGSRRSKQEEQKRPWWYLRTHEVQRRQKTLRWRTWWSGHGSRAQHPSPPHPTLDGTGGGAVAMGGATEEPEDPKP